MTTMPTISTTSTTTTSMSNKDNNTTTEFTYVSSMNHKKKITVLEDLFGVSITEEAGEEDQFRLDLSRNHDNDDDSCTATNSETDQSSFAHPDNDITLQGSDGVLVPANRTVLQSKNRVFQRLLFASFSMGKDGHFKSVEVPFVGKVVQAVVEFVLTDTCTAADLNIETIRATKRKHLKPTQSYDTTTGTTGNSAATANQKERSLLERLFNTSTSSTNNNNFQRPRRTPRSVTSSSRSVASRSMASSIHTVLPTLYSRQQLQTLVSLTRAAVYFQLPNLGKLVFQTLQTYLQKSPTAAFAVLEAIRQEPPEVPKELHGLALTTIRNYGGRITTEAIQFLSASTLEEILSDSKLRLDDYQLFSLVKRWAFAEEVTIMEDSTRKESNNNNTQSKNGDMDGEKEDRITVVQQMQLVQKYVKLEGIDPPLLATKVATCRDLVSKEELFQAFAKQAFAAHETHRISFQKPRYTSASWKRSCSDIFTSRFDGEFKQDVLNYPPIVTGRHQWTLRIEASGDSTWLGISLARYNLDEEEEDEEGDSDEEEEETQKDDNNDPNAVQQPDKHWVYGNDGEAFHGGVRQGPEPEGDQSTYPMYGTGYEIAFTLNLKSKDEGGGTLSACVNQGPSFVLFTNLRRQLQLNPGQGFLPLVSTLTPGQVRLVEIRQLHSH